jgi:hypothetical protein
VSVGIQNGWLDLEDLLSVGVAMLPAWLILFGGIASLGLTVFVEYISYKFFSSRKWYKFTIYGYALFFILLISGSVNLFSQKYYPWLEAGVITRTKAIHGTTPFEDKFKEYAKTEIGLIHLITLNNWVIFSYMEEVQKYDSNGKKIEPESNNGSLKTKGYLAIPISSIDSIFLENREKPNGLYKSGIIML